MELPFRDPRLTQRIGAVALLVLGALIVLLVSFDGCTFRSRFHVTVYFDHAGGLREDADVQVAGRVIGEVTDIVLVPAHETRPGHPLHPLGGVAVIIRVEDRFAHMTALNSEYFVNNKGLFGERYIEVGAPPGNGPRERPLQPGDEIRGVDPPQWDRMLVRAQHDMKLAREFARAMEPEARVLMDALSALADTLDSFAATPGELGMVRESLRAVAREARTLRATWQASEVTLDDLGRIARETRLTAERMSAAIADLRGRVRVLAGDIAELERRVPPDSFARLREALAKADDSLARAQRVIVNLREIASFVLRGEGTVGSLLKDPEFPEDAKNLGRMIKRHPWRLVGRPRERAP